MYFDEIIHRVDTFEMGESITIMPRVAAVLTLCLSSRVCMSKTSCLIR